MIADIKFLNVPQASLVARRYVIGTLDTAENVIYTAEDVKVSEELDFTLNIEYFDNYSKVNIIKVGDRYYDVLQVKEITRKSSVLQFAVTYNPISSLLDSGSSLYGWFERTPIKKFPAGRVITGSATMEEYERVPFTNITPIVIGDDQYDPYFVQVVSNYSIGAAEGYKNKLSVYGYFLDASDYMPSSDILPTTIYGNDNVKYPHFREIMSDSAAAYGLPADSIIDVSVSKRCPWQFDQRTFDSKPLIPLKRVAGGEVPSPSGATSFIAEISRYMCKPSEREVVTLNYSDYIRYNAVFNIVTESGEVVGAIPNEYFDSDNKLTIGWQTYADYTGLYTILDFNGINVVVPEGRLPWTGPEWSNYVARSREYDRQAMERAIATAKEQLNIDLLNGASNAMLTSAIGAAGGNVSGAVAGLAQFGLSAISSMRGFELNKSNVEFEQTLNENRIKAAPMSNYSTANGLDYFRRSKITGGMGIRIDMPSNLTEVQFNDQISYYGWPCNRIATITPKTGFIKGQIYNMDGYGLMGERLREEINNGVRIVIA